MGNSATSSLLSPALGRPAERSDVSVSLILKEVVVFTTVSHRPLDRLEEQSDAYKRTAATHVIDYQSSRTQQGTPSTEDRTPNTSNSLCIDSMCVCVFGDWILIE